MIRVWALKEASQERFLDLSEFLRGVPDDLVFEDEEEGDVWDHEARFTNSKDGTLDTTSCCTHIVLCVEYVSLQNGGRGTHIDVLSLNPAGEAQQPVGDVVGALDPNQADILSAYSVEQGASH